MSTQVKDALDLPRASASRPIAWGLRVRWLAPDGGVRIGNVVHHDDSGVTVVDLLRQETTYLRDGEYKRDLPKDDEGNAK